MDKVGFLGGGYLGMGIDRLAWGEAALELRSVRDSRSGSGCCCFCGILTGIQSMGTRFGIRVTVSC